MIRTAKLTFENKTDRAEVELKLEPVERPGAQTIDLEPCPPHTLRLSIVASTSHKARNGRWVVDGYGQCIDAVRDHKAAALLCDIWERWHLNDMRAGTRAQEQALRLPEFKPNPADWYGSACAHLMASSILNDRGYQFGSAWLVEPLPAEVVSELEAIVQALGGSFTDTVAA